MARKGRAVEDKENEEQVPWLSTQANRGGNDVKPPTAVGGQFEDDTAPLFMCCLCKTELSKPNLVYPHLNASICHTCSKHQPQLQVSEDQVSNKKFAPFSEKEITALHTYQNDEQFLAIVCPKGHKLLAEKSGMRCASCLNFTLDWVYAWIPDNSWKEQR